MPLLLLRDVTIDVTVEVSLDDKGGKALKRLEVVEEKGFEPSTPTLRTWCSPS